MAVHVRLHAPRPSPRSATRLAGELITPEHPDYDAARRVWNGMIDKRPAAIARCADADDVATARSASPPSTSLPLAVRGGGHNVAGTAVVDDGLVIDLSRDARRARSTPPARTVHVAGRRDLGRRRRASPRRSGSPRPAASCPRPASPGLALSGGVSHQRRRDGMTVDNLVSAEVVLADGRRRARERRRARRPVLGAARRRRQLRRRRPRSSCACTSSAPRSSRSTSPTRSRTPRACSPAGATPSPTRRTSSPPPGSSGRCRSSTSCPSSCAAQPYVGVAGMWAGDPGRGRARHARPARARDAAARHERRVAVPRLPAARSTRSSPRACATTGRRCTSTGSPTPRSTRPSTGRTAARRTTRSSSSATAAGRWRASAPRRPRSATAARSGCSASTRPGTTRPTTPPTSPRRASSTTPRRRTPTARRTSTSRACSRRATPRCAPATATNHDRLARIKAAYDPDNVFRLNQNIRPGRVARPTIARKCLGCGVRALLLSHARRRPGRSPRDAR